MQISAITWLLVSALAACSGCGIGSSASAELGEPTSSPASPVAVDAAASGGFELAAAASVQAATQPIGTATGQAATLPAGTTFGQATGSPTGAVTKYASMAGAALGPGASLNGAIPFPADNAWNRDISAAPVDPNSANLIAAIGLTRGIHPDFGSGLYNGAPIGIPYTVVTGMQPKVAIRFTAYGAESDPGPYPIPADAPVEGEVASQPGVGDGDRHVLVIDRDNNRLYELFRAFRNSDGSWNADAGAVFRLDSNNVRPTAQPRWTSADAAGLPIFPGLVRYDEAATGTIRHALRFTAPTTRRAYVPPASHWASSSDNPNLPPMGMRVRLRSTFQIPAGFSTESKAILQAMKTYGMILADNGGGWFVTGSPNPGWNDSRLKSELGQVKGADFEVLRMDGLVTP
jgi:hypothetical protein